MWQRFTERARRVVQHSQAEVRRNGESFVGTEHLLFGLVRDGDTVAARILDRIGLSRAQIRAHVESQLTRGLGSQDNLYELTLGAKRVLDLANAEALALGNDYIGTEHLLLGMIREREGIAARVLVMLGATLDRVRAVVYAMNDVEPPQPTGEAITK